jgi:hypothetical protein
MTQKTSDLTSRTQDFRYRNRYIWSEKRSEETRHERFTSSENLKSIDRSISIKKSKSIKFLRSRDTFSVGTWTHPASSVTLSYRQKTYLWLLYSSSELISPSLRITRALECSLPPTLQNKVTIPCVVKRLDQRPSFILCLFRVDCWPMIALDLSPCAPVKSTVPLRESCSYCVSTCPFPAGKFPHSHLTRQKVVVLNLLKKYPFRPSAYCCYLFIPNAKLRVARHTKSLHIVHSSCRPL